MEPETHQKFHRYSDESSSESHPIEIPAGEVHDLQQQPDLQPPFYSIDPNSYHVTVPEPQPNYSLGYEQQQSGGYQQSTPGYQQETPGYQQETYNTYQMGAVPLSSSQIGEQAAQIGNKVMESVSAKIGDYKASIKEGILSRDYQVSIKEWLVRSWGVYKQCWWGFSGLTLLMLILFVIPIVQYIGALFVLPIQGGMFIAACNSLRNGTTVRFGHLWHGLLFMIPLTILMILISILTSIGFFLCFVPGLFLMVTLSFSPWIYLEYYSSGISVLDSMALSVKMTTRRFFLILWFCIVIFLVDLLGVLLLGVGTLVAFPITAICYAFAVQEIFGLNSDKQIDSTCIVGM